MKKTNIRQLSQNKKHRVPLYRRVWFWAVLILIALLCGGMIWWFSHPATDSMVTDETMETEEISVEATENEPVAENEYLSEVDTEAPESKVTQYEAENPNAAGELSGAITRAATENGYLVIMTNVDQYLNGRCSLTMVGDNTGDTYDMTVKLLADVSTSYCDTFRIPIDALMKDYYQITITLSGNGKTGLITDGVQL